MDPSPMCRPLEVLAVSADRALLRGLARFLGEFGYRVQTAADPLLAIEALRGARPDFLVIDSGLGQRHCLEVCRAAVCDDQAACVYPLLLLPRQAAPDVAPFVAAGVHDFLARPIVPGELLARLRAGARFLEFERRLRELDGVDPGTGLANRAACLDRLRRELPSAALSHSTTACAVLELDAFDRVAIACGRKGSERALRTASESLVELAGTTAHLFAISTGRYAAVLPDADEDQAFEWAEAIRAGLSARTLSVNDETLRLTVSVGVADCPARDAAADALLERAERALVEACRSGRDCVVRHGQLADDERAWQESRAPGKLFEQTTAADVMSACALFARANDTLSAAAELLRQSGGDCLQVVGADGRLAGVVSLADVQSSGGGHDSQVRQVCEVLDPDVPTFAEDTSFAALMDFFVRDGGRLVVVTRDERPIGQVSRDALAALIEPITTGSFAAAMPFAPTSDYLRVPDLTPLA